MNNAQVGYTTSDVGVACIGYLERRIKFVDYSHPVGTGGAVWWSSLPRKLSPATNLIRTFDTMNWIAIGVSILMVSLFLTLVSYLGSHYGIGSQDYVDVLSAPFRILNGEAFPNWFDHASQKFFRPGFTGRFLLLLWSIVSMMIVMAFLSNIRAMLLCPEYEKPVDSTKGLIKSGKIPINHYKLSLWPNYLRDSSNMWENKAFEIGQPYDSEKFLKEVLLPTKVYTDGTHALLDNFEYVAYLLMTDPWYNNKTPPYFHISKEVLRPYYHGWIYNKVSKWKDDMDRHILTVQQVNTYK